jgi:hypothetical protein
MTRSFGKNTVKADFSKLEALIKKLDTPISVDIGVLKHEQYPDGTSVAAVAAANEFGSIKRGIVARSFIKVPLENGQDKIEADISSDLQGNLESGDIETIFKQIGVAGEGIIIDAFASSGDGKWAPNVPSTIAAKGSSKPLINTTTLEKAITSRVNNGA